MGAGSGLQDDDIAGVGDGVALVARFAEGEVGIEFENLQVRSGRDKAVLSHLA
jgi:hypothetical protein